MHISPHMLLIEPELDRTQMLSWMLSTIAVDVTRVPNPTQAALVLTQIQPDGLIVGLHPTTIRLVQPWLASLLAVNPLPTLLYTEVGMLLDVLLVDLPSQTATLLWPCSQSELQLAVQTLFGGFPR